MKERRVIYSHAAIAMNKQYPVAQNNSFDESACGIYIIQNIETDRCYVGASKNVAVRWATHRKTLLDGFPVCEMQTDFAKNPANFVFVLIERCTVDELEAREVFWVNVHDALSPTWGYNSRVPYYRTKRPDFTRIRVNEAMQSGGRHK